MTPDAPARRAFPQTRWTIIRQAAVPGSEEALRALEDLLQLYLPALKAEDQAMPADLLNVLYYAAIITALTKRKTRITELPDTSLRKGCAWCLQRPWLTGDLRALFLNSLKELDRS